MKILYLCTFYHQAMIFRDAMNALEKLGHDVLAFNVVAENTHILPKYQTIMDDKVIHVECFKKYDRYLYFYKQRKIYKSLKKNINIKQFDIIHSHTLFNGGWAAYKINKFSHTPYVVTVRNTDLNYFLKLPFFSIIAKKIIKNASKVVFLSPSYKKDFANKLYKQSSDDLNLFYKKSIIAPNGLESFWLHNINSPKTMASKQLKLLYVGRIEKNKNLKNLIDALKIIKSKGIYSTLTIVGEEIDKDIVNILKATDDVTLIPYQTKEELIKYYRSNDIFVMPSFTESFGRVYAEAMTQGLPVVYTQNQGFDGWFLKGEVGYSIDPCSPVSIADALVKIRSNYEMISKNCIDKCRTFDWSSIATKLERAYKQALE